MIGRKEIKMCKEPLIIDKIFKGFYFDKAYCLSTTTNIQDLTLNEIKEKSIDCLLDDLTLNEIEEKSIKVMLDNSFDFNLTLSKVFIRTANGNLVETLNGVFKFKSFKNNTALNKIIENLDVSHFLILENECYKTFYVLSNVKFNHATLLETGFYSKCFNFDGYKIFLEEK